MITLDLNREEVELVRNALETHDQEQLPGEVEGDPDRRVAYATVEALQEKCETCIARGTALVVTDDELHEIRQALDSHRYWDLSDINYRNSGNVMDPGSDDPECVAAIVELDKLDEKLAELEPAA